MLKQAFSDYLRQLALLTERQRKVLKHALDAAHGGSGDALLGEVCARPAACPHCHAGTNGLRPWGQSHGLPRYRCHATVMDHQNGK